MVVVGLVRNNRKRLGYGVGVLMLAPVLLPAVFPTAGYCISCVEVENFTCLTGGQFQDRCEIDDLACEAAVCQEDPEACDP